MSDKMKKKSISMHTQSLTVLENPSSSPQEVKDANVLKLQTQPDDSDQTPDLRRLFVRRDSDESEPEESDSEQSIETDLNTHFKDRLKTNPIQQLPDPTTKQ